MKILFATDCSECAQNAAKFLAKFHFPEPYELIIASLYYDPTLAVNEHLPWANEWQDQETERVETAHDQIEAFLQNRCTSIKRIHRVGSPQRELPIIAEKEKADLIVVGAVGHSTVRRLLLGSVSDHIATHADCSVLVVRPGELESDETFKRIMVAYDGSEPANEMIDELKEYTLSKDAEISVATVLHEYEYLAGDTMAETIYKRQSEWFEKQRVDNQRAVKDLREHRYKVQSVVEQGMYPDDVLVNLATELNSQLIMIGDAGHTFWDELLMGSTTKHILRNAPCSVWISRHHRRPDSKESSSAKQTAHA